VQPKVQILLSVFNGGQFLKDQIESVINQTFTDWQLLIKDDNSKDNSLQIIEGFCKAYPEKIKLVNTNSGGSSTKSFMSLLSLVSAPYAMFCDQDDVWVPEKIEASLAEIRALEKSNTVALVYTDMMVVNEKLAPIHSSFLKQHKLNPEWAKKTTNALVQSLAAGCTMLFTKSLISRLNPIDATLFQHDHWLLMHAAHYGKISFLNKATVYYRQHEQNSVGAHGVSNGYFIRKLASLKIIIKRWQYILKYFMVKGGVFNLAFTKLLLNLKRLL
jgi:glycosyltransferase involved in cell wall biosynthesis